MSRAPHFPWLPSRFRHTLPGFPSRALVLTSTSKSKSPGIIPALSLFMETTMQPDDTTSNATVTVAKTYTLTCTYMETCLPDYVPNGRWVGVPVRGQTREQIADDLVDDFSSYDSSEEMPEEISDDQIRAAVVACLNSFARFWPVNNTGDEIETTDSDDPRLEGNDEQPYAWFVFNVEEND